MFCHVFRLLQDSTRHLLFVALTENYTDYKLYDMYGGSIFTQFKNAQRAISYAYHLVVSDDQE